MFSEPLFQFRTPIVTVGEHPTRGTGQQLFGNRHFMDIGWGDSQSDNDARPADMKMRAHTEEGLSSHLVMAISRDVSQAAASVSPGEAADWQRHAVNDREGRVKGYLLQQGLPKAGFNHPEICCLADKGRSVNANQFRKVMSIMSLEVEKDTLVRTYAKESTNDFDGQHFTVMQPW
jgi:hypothetical protein